jgi:uncharacterized protein YfcZ (UPF0381/DUF406 family)
MACLTFLAWRIAQVFDTMNQTMAVVSNDVTQVTNSASRVAAKVDEAVSYLEKMEAKAKDVVSIDEVASVINEISEVRDNQNAPVATDEKAKIEITYLLNCVRESNCRFGHDNDIRSASNYYIRLHAKFIAYKDGLRSAEDFIDKVATRTIGGNDYFVVLETGTKQSLRDWFTEKLTERRKGDHS